MLRKSSQLRDPQKGIVLHQLTHDHSMVWAGCGMGKTPVTLTTIAFRIKTGQVKKVLVFAPVRVCHAVWERESQKWEHTNHLRFSNMSWPSEKKRLAALNAEADVYLCNWENMGWLSNQLKKDCPFDMVVYDEVTRGKMSTSKRIAGGRRRTKKGVVVMKNGYSLEESMAAGWSLEMLIDQGYCDLTPDEFIRITGWRKIIPKIKFSTGLTGTPASNGYLDLHGQYLLIDGGERLGHYITNYKGNYFTKGYDGFSWEVSDHCKTLIEQQIADITIKVEGTSSHNLFINDIIVDLPPKVMVQYKQIEQDMFTRLDDGTELEMFTRASVSNKCLQMCNGAPYKAPNEPEYSEVHDVKLQALDSIIEESGGNTVLVGYSFKSDAERIMKRYKSLNPINLTKSKPQELLGIIKKGIAGEIKLMIGHPASLGHGVDGLNEFCNTLVWFGCNWSLELYLQMIGRIAAGERHQTDVTMHRILAADTLDLAVVDALLRKDTEQNGLKKAIQRYRDGLTPRDGSINFW